MKLSISQCSRMRGLIALALAASCGTTDDQARRIEVTSDNALGVVSLETTTSVQNGEEHFGLRAFDAAGNEVGSIQRRHGAIVSTEDDGTQVIGIGSEFQFAASGETAELVTYESETTLLYPQAVAKVQELLELREVTAQLASQHVLVLIHAPSPVETAFGESAHACAASSLFAPTGTAGGATGTPIAKQCCTAQAYYYTWDADLEDYVYHEYPLSMFFVPDRGPNQNRYINRHFGGACKRSDGVTNCTSGKSPAQGGDCYFGPNGWAINSISGVGTHRIYANTYQTGQGSDTECKTTTSAGTITFSNITGTGSPGTCAPGGNSGGWQGEY